MAKLSIVAGATSQSVNIFVQDSSSTTGAGLSGLVFNSSGLAAYYTFTGANATATVISLVTLAAVNSAYSSGGFKEIQATNMKGLYRLDIPNAALASGNGRAVTIYLYGATNMAPVVLEIELTGWDNQDGVHGGMTAMPNAAAGANGGLPLQGSAVPNANAGAAGGLWILGANAAATTTLTGVAASGATPATEALTLTGGAASTTGGGTAARGLTVTGGAGAASTNGAAAGAKFVGGGTNTVASTASGLIVTGTSTGHGLDCESGAGATGNGLNAVSNASNGSGATLTGVGTGKDLNAQSTNALQVNATAINAVSTSSVTTVGANVGTTQPVNFTGSGGSALVQCDTRDFLGHAVVLDGNNYPGINVVDLAGAASTGAAGYVGLDWGQVTNKTTTNALTGTTISTTQTITSVSGSVGSVTGAVGSVTGNVGGNVAGSVGSVAAAVTLSAADSPTIRTGTAQAGASTSITLDAGASGTTNAYTGCLVKITSGTGSSAGQCRTITAYNGTSKVATVDYAWEVNPDATSVFAVLYADSPALNASLQVTAASVSGVTFPTNFSSLLISAGGHISNVDTLTTYTGNTPQTGDSYARLGAPAGASIAADLAEIEAETDTLLAGVNVTSINSVSTSSVTAVAANIGSAQPINSTGTGGSATVNANASLSGNVTVGGYAGGQDPATLVLDVAASSHNIAGSIGNKISSAASAGDPWSTNEPGNYAPGTFGNLVATNLNAQISGLAGQCNSLLATLASVAGKTALIGTGSAVAFAPVAPGGTLTLYRGDDYRAADGRQLLWTFSGQPDLTGVTTIDLIVGSTTFAGAGAVVVPSGSQQQVQVELTAAQTLSLTVGFTQTYSVRVTLADGHRTTLVTGAAIVS